MDVLDQFNFEEVVRHGDGDPSLASASVEGPMQIASSPDKRPKEVVQRSEGRFGQRVSEDEQYLDSFEDLDDVSLAEAMQHIPSFGHQVPSHEQRLRPASFLDDTVLEKDIQNADEVDNQSHDCRNHMQFSSDVGDFVAEKALQHAEQEVCPQTTHEEQYMDWMDDAIFEEALRREQDLAPLQLPEQPSMSLQQDSIPQQYTRDDGEDVSHRVSTREAFKEARMQPSDDSSHIWTSGKAPDEESLEAQALSEALQYAYGNNLTTDYLSTSFSVTHLFGPLVAGTIPTTNDDGFTDHSHLADAKIPNPVVLEKSKTLTITSCALRLIAEARHVQSEEEIQSLTDEVCNLHKFKPSKLELPILRTDNDRDLTAFQERCVVRSDALLRSIKKHRLPLYPQNLEEGEGMELSSKTRAETEIVMKKTEEEKIGATKKILTYLVSQLKGDYTLENQIQNMVGEITYEKARTSRPPRCMPSPSDQHCDRPQEWKRSPHQSVPNSLQRIPRLPSILGSFQFPRTIQIRCSVTTFAP